MKLYKTTVVIWSEFDPRNIDLSTLARDAESGGSYCSKQTSDRIDNPETDPDWDGTEFFQTPDE